MTAKIIRTFFSFIILLLLVACGKNITVTTPPIAVPTTMSSSATPTLKSSQSMSTSSPMVPATFTPLSATETQQAWLATARAIDAGANTATQQAREQIETQVAQFPVACDKTDFNSSVVSPDGNWLAITCGYKRDQILIVQNKGNKKWVLEFKDFLSPITIQDGGVPMGSLYPKFWSPDGAYLYFTPIIGYDGGGDECFPGFGDDGLFRLDLKSGSWATLIPPTDSLIGYEIKFSPTGRRYATDVNGVTITDLKTGIVSKIDISDTVEELSWSPDGTQLAFTVASCSDDLQGTLQSSSVYVWDALKNEKHILFTTNEMVLRPEVWIDNSTVRVVGEKWFDHDIVYMTYIFDAVHNSLTFTGTATPEP